MLLMLYFFNWITEGYTLAKKGWWNSTRLWMNPKPTFRNRSMYEKSYSPLTLGTTMVRMVFLSEGFNHPDNLKLRCCNCCGNLSRNTYWIGKERLLRRVCVMGSSSPKDKLDRNLLDTYMGDLDEKSNNSSSKLSDKRIAATIIKTEKNNRFSCTKNNNAQSDSKPR